MQATLSSLRLLCDKLRLRSAILPILPHKFLVTAYALHETPLTTSSELQFTPFAGQPSSKTAAAQVWRLRRAHLAKARLAGGMEAT